MEEPPGADRDLGEGQGHQGGGRTVTVNGGRRRWVREATMWAALCSEKGGKELVQHIEMDTMMNNFLLGGR